MAQTLDYHRPSTDLPEPNGKPLSVAIACGAGPLAAGILTFLIWLPFRHPAFAILGMFIVVVGFGMFVCGMFAVFMYMLTNWPFLTSSPHRARHWKSIVLTVLLLVSNWPVCILIVKTVTTMDPSLID